MNDLAGGFPGTFVSADDGLAREFEERLRDSGTLAFRLPTACSGIARTPKTWRRSRWRRPTGASASFGIANGFARGSCARPGGWRWTAAAAIGGA